MFFPSGEKFFPFLTHFFERVDTIHIFVDFFFITQAEHKFHVVILTLLHLAGLVTIYGFNSAFCFIIFGLLANSKCSVGAWKSEQYLVSTLTILHQCSTVIRGEILRGKDERSSISTEKGLSRAVHNAKRPPKRLRFA